MSEDHKLPMPDSISFPPELVEDWVGIPPDAEINAKIRRQDLDRLYSAIDKSLHATDRVRRGVVHFVNGSTDEGNAALDECSRLLIESQNAMRQFMLAMMVSATRNK